MTLHLKMPEEPSDKGEDEGWLGHTDTPTHPHTHTQTNTPTVPLEHVHTVVTVRHCVCANNFVGLEASSF